MGFLRCRDTRAGHESTSTVIRDRPRDGLRKTAAGNGLHARLRRSDVHIPDAQPGGCRRCLSRRGFVDRRSPEGKWSSAITPEFRLTGIDVT